MFTTDADERKKVKAAAALWCVLPLLLWIYSLYRSETVLLLTALFLGGIFMLCSIPILFGHTYLLGVDAEDEEYDAEKIGSFVGWMLISMAFVSFLGPLAAMVLTGYEFLAFLLLFLTVAGIPAATVIIANGKRFRR